MSMSPYYPFRSEQAKAEYTALLAERARAWPVPSETVLLETPSARTFVRISGQPTNHPPLILLHGARGHSLMWVPNIAQLSAHFRTYALDSIHDIGLSASRRHTREREYLLNWLDEVLDQLVPEGQFNLLGLSYGGWLASQAAKRRPERIRRLVLMAPAATVLPVSSALLIRALLTLIPGPAFRQQFYYWLLDDAVQSGDAGRAFVDQAVADWLVADRCFGPLPMIPATVLSDNELQAFEVPTLFLVGENEKMYSAASAVARLNRIAPHIRTEIIPHAGHDLWMSQADLVTHAILDFLAEQEKTAARPLPA